MLIALITSVVWTSVNADYSTKDQEIGVLSDTSEAEIVRNHLNGIPKEYDSYQELVGDIRKKIIRVGLIDQNVAAFLMEKMNIHDLKIERKIDVTIFVRLFFINDNSTSCDETEYKKEEMENIISEYIPPHQVTKYHVRPLYKTFDNADEGLLLGTSITAGIIVLSAIIIEIVSKCRNRNKKTLTFNGVDKLQENFEKTEEYKNLSNMKRQADKYFEKVKEEAFKRFLKNNHLNSFKNVVFDES